MDAADTLIFRTVVVTILALASVVASCTAFETAKSDEAMVEMVVHGADPLAARCAVRGTACDLAALKK